VASTLILNFLSGSTVWAQESVSVRADLLFYGDDTEFHGPFRDGETLFGAAGRLYASAVLNERVTIDLGVFGDHRYGGGGFERAVPIASLAIGGPRSMIVIGTLRARRNTITGPDRDGPHGLLPPIQRDSLAFERPYEAGLEWTARGLAGTHDGWLNWQRLNTAEHRERFDTGVHTQGRVVPGLDLGVQIHVVHQGGQLFASGPVADSAAYAAGALIDRPVGVLGRASFEVWAAMSRDVPDRQTPAASLTGRGIFLRAAAARAGWRGHLIVWRGRDFVKDEGDPNYQSRRLEGSRYRGTRDYSEAGVSRRFVPAKEVTVDLSGRAHRVEGQYNYSFRITAIANLIWRVR